MLIPVCCHVRSDVLRPAAAEIPYQGNNLVSFLIRTSKVHASSVTEYFSHVTLFLAYPKV